MAHKTLDEKYDVEILDKDFRPDKENPEKVVVKMETALTHPNTGEEKVFKTNKVFLPRQIKSGRWKEHTRQWVDEMRENMAEKNDEYDVDTGVTNVG